MSAAINISAEDIKPKIPGKSDFFSWQLYRWAKKNPHAVQVWLGTWNPATGIDRANQIMFIGFMDKINGALWFHGRMMRNLCLQGQTLVGYAYGPQFDTSSWTEITEQFWSEYMRIGVCAIHGDLAHKWETNGDERSCAYCEKREVKKVRLVERTTWEAA